MTHSNNSNKLLHEVATLLALCMEGDIQPEQFDHLQTLLRGNPAAREHYYRLLAMHATLQETESILALQNDLSKTPYDQELWDALSVEEQTATAIEIPLVKQPEEIIQHVERKKIPFAFSKSSRFTFAASIAASLLIILLLRFAPQPIVEVATVTNSINSIFSDNKPYQPGTRLARQDDPLWLQKGVIEIEFDYGASVVIEAPAEFKLNSEENISLLSGRLYAHVPDRSKGFMVETPNSRVIDLGTEFGIKVDFDGTSALHMIKGKASLFSGSRGQTGQGQILTAGQARHVDSKGDIQTIQMRENEFARTLLPDQGIVWRGQDFDLADIVRGGSGLGTGKSGIGIDPTTGNSISIIRPQDLHGQGEYTPVSFSPFIDGVFIPDGGHGPITVSSEGHQCTDCPDTDGFFRYEIISCPQMVVDPNRYKSDDPRPREEQLMLMAMQEGYPSRLMGLHAAKQKPGPEDTSLLLHANMGLTFDLQPLQAMLPGGKIVRFSALFGIAEVCPEPSDLDLMVLVDGRTQLKKQDIAHPNLVDIQIELSESDRFLTLMVTESGSNSLGGLNAALDWGLFLNPKVEIE
ncbi:MAG: FecR domain-containing protein [Sedimentisphaerales bacterium]|nr:FecR domain-containing protein [Sedimentisphaerales bacterium]